MEKNISKLEALIFSQKIFQLGKALWKSIEKDWQQWIKPYDLNINEHHILWIAYHLDGASISDVAKFGVMHVSTAFNFSKKLEEKGYLTFSKKVEDKRNTYIRLTEKGEKLVLELLENYDLSNQTVLLGAKPLKEIYGKYPDILELMAIVRNIYGDDFMEIFQKSFDHLEQVFKEDHHKGDEDIEDESREEVV
ncbi:HTH-type transcriptional regulator Hpr [Fervidibacillus halotolerans]|uniref:HTH-type transcriptional regulator Hpr n=1 Tax=Fervidibacillus halotolerans TaxID=2980027 RepID=A0A9E8M053_9BACI|nr:HTH-type transcriptional regulator Hpr [Fervidibacillus halotolerans]WAA13013.1 HTH-type transcriptional regulator Hpr [Fervidibacillus halotolerans]